jgi:hypothetical protein
MAKNFVIIFSKNRFLFRFFHERKDKVLSSLIDSEDSRGREDGVGFLVVCVDDNYRSCRHTMEDSGGGMLKLIDGRIEPKMEG